MYMLIYNFVRFQIYKQIEKFILHFSAFNLVAISP